MKHNSMATANAAAVTIGLFYIVCQILIFIFPDMMLSLVRAWFHGLTLGSWDLASGSFLIGLISSVATAWLVGYTFATSYNSFAKK